VEPAGGPVAACLPGLLGAWSREAGTPQAAAAVAAAVEVGVVAARGWGPLGQGEQGREQEQEQQHHQQQRQQGLVVLRLQEGV